MFSNFTFPQDCPTVLISESQLNLIVVPNFEHMVFYITLNITHYPWPNFDFQLRHLKFFQNISEKNLDFDFCFAFCTMKLSQSNQWVQWQDAFSLIDSSQIFLLLRSPQKSKNKAFGFHRFRFNQTFFLFSCALFIFWTDKAKELSGQFGAKTRPNVTKSAKIIYHILNSHFNTFTLLLRHRRIGILLVIQDLHKIADGGKVGSRLRATEKS